ncbi:uracil phosphoribosyltransferase [Paraconexibacter antarcticus]|uniref:Uracil phosphoribosyltransferase n=1 Tax=Paraconexibacter antarcticus TaxID=2949664 RepID=A0ABY5DYV9_9ACTN|nr:uracil phosphoribosyltransferase [Paraconexibacter antarcticus]UTI65805.1 uracil phosphoribosyltransferase [Paraconexibacter antarcticus]
MVLRPLHVVDHPLLARQIAVLRSVATGREQFRAALAEAAGALAYEALRDVPVAEVTVRTPLEETTGAALAHPVMVVAVLRAGLGMVDGFLRLVPDAAVGHLGMRRNEETLQPEDYYESLPAGVEASTVFVVDPMLATGGSAVAALTRMRRAGARDLRLVCLVAAPEGVAAVHAAFPDVPITAGALDRGLDARGFIRPGLGDAGDRIFGTE